MGQVQTLRIVVASPSDAQSERNMLPGVLDELNRGIARDRGLRLELTRWETDAYPGFHPGGPQGLIDPVLRIEDCDLLIGIFWRRFGTPVSAAKSGTEHEFRRAYETWQQNRRPQIMVYFNQKPFWPTKAEIDQLRQVLEFQENFPKEGLWWPYKSKAHFEKLVRNHLTQYIRKFVNGYFFDVEYVLVQPGEFLMGSADGPGEQPIHKVRITRPFYLSKYAVTQRQWEAVMGNNPSRFKNPDYRPVENVSWWDVQEFIRTLNGIERAERYRLPTEAEWEYACRGSAETIYCHGDDANRLGEYAWYDANANGQTHPVGQRKPNAWGLYDMHGNIYEWVQDWWQDRYEAHSTEAIADPIGAPSGSERANRGGCWGHDASACRSAHRGHLTPDSRRDDLGFRLLRMPS